MRPDETLRDKTVRVRIGRAGPGRKHLRLDQPYEPPGQGDGSDAPAPESRGLVERLREAIFAARRDRRDLIRHAVVDHDVWVGWWTRDEFGAVLGRLENLSRGGARLVLTCRPPRKQPVWLYKEVGATLAFVRGQVVGLGAAPGGAYSVRLQFATPCPTNLCQATICGDPPKPGAPHPAPFEPPPR